MLLTQKSNKQWRGCKAYVLKGNNSGHSQKTSLRRFATAFQDYYCGASFLFEKESQNEHSLQIPQIDAHRHHRSYQVQMSSWCVRSHCGSIPCSEELYNKESQLLL